MSPPQSASEPWGTTQTADDFEVLASEQQLKLVRIIIIITITEIFRVA